MPGTRDAPALLAACPSPKAQGCPRLRQPPACPGPNTQLHPTQKPARSLPVSPAPSPPVPGRAGDELHKRELWEPPAGAQPAGPAQARLLSHPWSLQPPHGAWPEAVGGPGVPSHAGVSLGSEPRLHPALPPLSALAPGPLHPPPQEGLWWPNGPPVPGTASHSHHIPRGTRHARLLHLLIVVRVVVQPDAAVVRDLRQVLVIELLQADVLGGPGERGQGRQGRGRQARGNTPTNLREMPPAPPTAPRGPGELSGTTGTCWHCTTITHGTGMGAPAR